MKNPFIIKALEVNSTHITESDNEILLNAEDCPLATYKMVGGEISYGHMIYTGLDDDFFSPDDLKTAGISEALISLLNFARENNCKFLHVDEDGETYEDLPAFDW